MESNRLSNDQPLVNPADDLLGYAGFADNLAESIIKMAPLKGFVIGLYGPWGSGKSTLLNFVEHNITERTDEEKPEVIRYNPWWISGREDIALDLMCKTLEALNSVHAISQINLKKAIKISRAFRAIKIPYITSTELVADFLRLFVADIHKFKEILDKGLDDDKNKYKRVLVIIDDIDRLTSEEIRSLFRAIKAVGGFKNVIYLIACDYAVVARALEDEQKGIDGEKYLDKIVQLPSPLPTPDEFDLNHLFVARFAEIIGDEPNTFDSADFGNIFHDAIKYFLKTPRDIVKLINRLSFVYPKLEGEVNPVDLLAIESIHCFCNEVYETIKNNPVKFAGAISDFDVQFQRDKPIKAFHDEWQLNLKDKIHPAVIRLLTRIFPKFEACSGNRTVINRLYKSDFLQRRISVPEVFPQYFGLAPQSGFSRDEIDTIIGLTSNVGKFAGLLQEYIRKKNKDGSTRTKSLLSLLVNYSDGIPDERIKNVVEAIFIIGDSLLVDEDKDDHGWIGNEGLVWDLVGDLLIRIDEKERFRILYDAFSISTSISLLVDIIYIIYDHNTDRESKNVLITNPDFQEELKNLGISKINKIPVKKGLLNTPELNNVLFRYREWAGVAETMGLISILTESDDDLVVFLSKFVGIATSQSERDLVLRRNKRFNYESVESLIDPSTIIERVRNLSKTVITNENELLAISKFIENYDKRIVDGKEPSSNTS